MLAALAQAAAADSSGSTATGNRTIIATPDTGCPTASQSSTVSTTAPPPNCASNDSHQSEETHIGTSSAQTPSRPESGATPLPCASNPGRPC
jgi:hypothetical protein